MRTFRYARDWLCCTACAGYAVNRWVLPSSVKGVFMRHHFADLLLIPAALPLLLWLQRRLGLRGTDDPPTWREVGVTVVVWSLAAEGVGPLIFPQATADLRDVLAYAVGGFVAGLIWRSR
ncbi:hypothetical protein MASR2M8_15130 [Opitutaceae bacterium]